jgi:hypothetical protein
VSHPPCPATCLQVALPNGQMLTCSRDLALIYYLTKDWQQGYGGLLQDLEGGATFVPQYNSAVVFRVPRYHEVTALATSRHRYSVGSRREPGGPACLGVVATWMGLLVMLQHCTEQHRVVGACGAAGTTVQ